MNIDKTVESSYQLKNIRLVETLFKFPVVFPLDNLSIQIKNEPRTIDENIICQLKVLLSQTNEDKEFKMEITMEGIFEKKGEDKLSHTEFEQISAPSIIYPYIRQQVRYLSLEAGLNAIILPVINFQAFHQSNIAQKSDTPK